jgi:hypothetical protein
MVVVAMMIVVEMMRMNMWSRGLGCCWEWWLLIIVCDLYCD